LDDVDLADPGLDPRADGGDPELVELEGAGDVDQRLDLAGAGGLDLEAHLLGEGRREADDALFVGRDVAGLLDVAARFGLAAAGEAEARERQGDQREAEEVEEAEEAAPSPGQGGEWFVEVEHGVNRR